MLFGGLSVDGLSNRFDLLDTQTRTRDTAITSQLSNILSQRQDAEMARVGQWYLVAARECHRAPFRWRAAGSLQWLCLRRHPGWPSGRTGSP